jgi:Co/Zn/Cd efflux system component
MHTHDLSAWQHDHVFDAGNAAAERSTRWVLWLTAAMMVAEIAAGWFYNSMALLADGFHEQPCGGHRPEHLRLHRRAPARA